MDNKITIGRKVIGKFDKKVGTITKLGESFSSRTALRPWKTLVYVTYDDESQSKLVGGEMGMSVSHFRSYFRFVK